MENFNYARTARLVREAIEGFELDLSGLTVYTEAATGGYAATAATAVAAGADTVYALAEDSSYGSAEEAQTHTTRLAERIGDEQRLVFPDRKRRTHVASADVVTNTGFVRPIDEQMVDWMSPVAAVPLMYEPWEFRADDMDIDALWTKGVPVLGTDERDERVATQRYLGALAAQIALMNDLEVYRGTFVVVGDGRMALHAARGLDGLGADVTRVSPAETESAVDTLDDEQLAELDAVVVVDHETDRLLVGDGGLVEPAELADRTSGTTVLHICGPLEKGDLNDSNIRYVPENPAPVGTMSYTTGHLGPRPIVELHGAGLRIGADLSRAQHGGADFRAATDRVAATPLAQDFCEEFKQGHGYYG